MTKRFVLQDAMGLWILLTISLAVAVVLNEFRSKPLPLVYSPPEVRLDQAVENLSQGATPAVSLDGDVSLDEMRKISTGRTALILDARPEIFYRLGHIPSALSLPRDDFEKQYQAVESVLQTHRNQVLIVYCSGLDCHDSQMVGDSLERLGYSHVRLFRGGWSDWEGGNLPQEKE